MDADPPTTPGRAKSQPAPTSRKVQAFRWYTVAVAVVLGGGKLIDVETALLTAAVQHLTYELGMVVGANELGDHAAGAVGKVGELVAGALAGRRP